MNNPTPASKTTTPWHLWLVGVLALLWNCIGAFDYAMTETHNTANLDSLTAEQRK